MEMMTSELSLLIERGKACYAEISKAIEAATSEAAGAEPARKKVA